MMSLDPELVARELGVPVDDRVTDCTRAAQSWVETRRCNEIPETLWMDPAIVHGGVLYATLLFKQRSQPQGFAGIDALGTFGEDTGAIMSQVYRLVGASAVIA